MKHRIINEMFLNYRFHEEEDNLELRFFSLKYEGDRVISGTAINYNDIAKLNKRGDKEKFETGAFGDLSNEDVILNFQHDRCVPLARTGDGGLELQDTAEALTLRATLPNTKAADDALELIKANVIRGFSIEFVPEKRAKKNGVIIISKAKLKNIAIVDRPAYNLSKINRELNEDLEMNENEIRGIIEEELKKRNATDVDASTIAKNIHSDLEDLVDKAVEEQVREQIQEVMEERDKESQARAAAEEEKDNLEIENKKKDEERKKQREEDEKDMETKAESRAELIYSLKPLLPKDTETRGKSNHELLVLAVGDTIDDAEKRSEDYLTAKTEVLLENREKAGSQNTTVKNNLQTRAGYDDLNVIRLIERKGSAQTTLRN